LTLAHGTKGKFSGHAVRIATELNLHQSYSKAIKGSAEHFEGARLWYFLYVCDHHFSIAYGRPPVIQKDAAIAGHEKFLQLPGVTQADFRLHSQVAMFIILTEIYNAFGSDVEQTLAPENLNQLRHFNISLDTWFLKWEPQLAPSTYISSYPSKGVGLHYHFAKLQLNSVSIRGFQQLPHQHLPTDRQEFADIAISSAVTILSTVLREPDIRAAIVGVPIYLHTMITYAAVFLLKMQLKWKSVLLSIKSVMIRDLVGQVIKLLNEARASDRHLTYHMASGLSKMLERCTTSEGHEDGQVAEAQAGANSLSAAVDMEYGFHADHGPYGMHVESMDLFDENYFPVGFFDVLSSYMPD
jgi:hypothetical protein